MKREEVKEKWQELSARVLEEVVRWREEHPKATMREIETEIDDRLFELRAKVLADTAEGRGEARRAEKCPECGGRLVKKGKKTRKLLLRAGQAVELEREYMVCLECGRGIFPPR